MAVYLIYYSGNIIYDLFLKKGKENYKVEMEEFSLSEISEQYANLTKNVGIEDVENISTPKSFSKNQRHSEISEGMEERQDLEYLKERFESEQDLDEFENSLKNNPVQNENEPFHDEVDSTKVFIDQKEILSVEKEKKNPVEVFHQSPITVDTAQENSRIKEWKSMLNLSETLVQLVANNDGHKIYQSIM
ncbi:hypothetical protein EB354_03240 [Chryseobacterium balustinum]|uniref:Uncharacterized protein n=1 Tax=Chryseobacterium balustinum TaxID=246 RepID=A0AAX2IRP1_9FLAO|nr:hypothetical protein EB354_03240 [Chryseobacterium balustinum]SQA92730.1 Uncharacterised protein [Chryseobacterium balustinum]